MVLPGAWTGKVAFPIRKADTTARGLEFVGLEHAGISVRRCSGKCDCVSQQNPAIPPKKKKKLLSVHRTVQRPRPRRAAGLRMAVVRVPRQRRLIFPVAAEADSAGSKSSRVTATRRGQRRAVRTTLIPQQWAVRRRGGANAAESVAAGKAGKASTLRRLPSTQPLSHADCKRRRSKQLRHHHWASP